MSEVVASGPISRSVRSRRRLAVVIAAVLAAVALLGVSGLERNLVFYRTPSELLADPALAGQRVRLGGLVQPGTVEQAGAVMTFTLTDGVTDVRVRYAGPAPGVFQAGQNALVEGVLGGDGGFRADQVMVKHSDTYRGPGATSTPPASGHEAR